MIKPGLDRMRRAWPYIRDISAEGPLVVIGGTNGKGTTSGFLWQLLTAAGIRTGLFTSPHLINFRERFWCPRPGGVPAKDPFNEPVHDPFGAGSPADHQLEQVLDTLQRRLPPPVFAELSFFEMTTLMGMVLFREAACEAVILEVGLGGRWDSTNMFDADVSVITSVGLDHCEYLGPTVAHIAREKAGIMRRGHPVVFGGRDNTDPEAVAVLAAEAAAIGALWFEPGGMHYVSDLQVADWPRYLRNNFQLACLAAEKLLEQRTGLAAAARRVLPGAIRAVVAGAAARVAGGQIPRPPSLAGRYDLRRAGYPGEQPRVVLLDVCHNPHGARALALALRDALQSGRLSARPPALVSILKDKDHEAILAELLPVLGDVRLFAVPGERSWAAADLGVLGQKLPFFPEFRRAWQAAVLAHAATPDLPLLICGSVHAVGEVMRELGLMPG